ncbi:TetR/AcrR family transcriptional regulator [Glutamicibacter nicotianae]|uniref:TetR/AcrR family transcriptional regulator n=1 Tax=Glutamicibacter nicotianae TaxID=37929 RepID=UPI00195AD8DD|nr:TetR/AcrR family transcriptional regulator [Glutamicibacter nicotianae]MBM7767514.1 AcrR family transcriptional regulator [Glutamicibacter nicotianae]
MGIREERKAATLKAIHAAALELVESDGLDAVTVGQIAARAGISERTFFRYCDSREAAIVPAQHELIEAVTGCEIAPGSTSGQIFRLLADECRKVLGAEIRGSEYRRISRLIIIEPKLLLAITRQEEAFSAATSEELQRRGLLPAMPALIIGETLASLWRVAWQCFGQAERAGEPADPVELFDAAKMNLVLLAGPVPE